MQQDVQRDNTSLNRRDLKTAFSRFMHCENVTDWRAVLATLLRRSGGRLGDLSPLPTPRCPRRLGRDHGRTRV